MAKLTREEWLAKERKQVTNLSGIQKIELIDKIYDDLRVTTEAFLPQSGYSITLSAFSRGDLIKIQGMIRREEVYREETYKIIYRHIVDTSLGKLTLEEFLTNTSYLDLETLSYLLYTATFKDSGTYTFTCLNPECEMPMDIKLNNSSLIKVNNLELYDQMRTDALKEKLNIEEFVEREDFFRNKEIFLELDESKFLVVLREPSLAEDAWTLRYAKNEKIKDDPGKLGAIECIKQLEIPLSNGEVIVFKDKEDLIEQMSRLPYQDQKEIIDAADEILYSGLITYQIDKVKCPHCGEEYEDLPISMSNILFYTIYVEEL